MERYGMIIKLRPNKKEEYIEVHKNVPSAVLSALKENNISNNTVFMADDLLFMYLEYNGNDFLADWGKYCQNESVRSWFDKMRELLIPYETPIPATAWTIMEDVFHLD